MAIITSQQISNYYDNYSRIDVTFNKTVMEAMGLLPKQIYIKVSGHHIPCIIYSTSMVGAKILANITTPIMTELNNSETHFSLRFCFNDPDKKDTPIMFFVGFKVAGLTPYKSKSGNLYFINLTFLKRPPDDLIEKLGTLLDATNNAKNRKEERIIITPEVLRKMDISSKNATILIDNIPRKIIIRDLSFSGAKVIILGFSKYLQNKPCFLKIELKDNRTPLLIEGCVLRLEQVEGHKDISAIAIQFNQTKVPVRYNILINEYLTQIRK